jgi:hypothetical protein
LKPDRRIVLNAEITARIFGLAVTSTPSKQISEFRILGLGKSSIHIVQVRTNQLGRFSKVPTGRNVRDVLAIERGNNHFKLVAVFWGMAERERYR